jgi:hypothetical protein
MITVQPLAATTSNTTTKAHSASSARNPKNFTAKGAKLREVKITSSFFFFAQLRVLRAFAVTHLKIGHKAVKRRDLGKSSRREKDLQDINEKYFL